MAAEIARVCRDGGVIAMAVEYCDVPDGRPVGGLYVLGDAAQARINSVEQLKALFGASVGRSYLAHDAPARRSHTEERLIEEPSSVLLVFENVKPDRTA